ncbi:TetR/AcrR family transcriptional regulator [Streptomyces albipurpureus]|uniref:TetR family transcriptional regulator C-terminal domain-containing protein n=1 Tax=Streptomyces albipurpureus TaxID=2897419 RepID=A0ABT0UGR3_9ACTN|nr:TetR family transcriptional regulator C-terminal domain-containing protein [Streptomyces sp. CWNU-1]MCM2387290.1 TetR family transcriptional regulator C-terminal domain-containing protein [Streptomyces sp. CWNU-1]
MPARIDAQQRRQHVVEAAFRLVVAQGLEGMSLRKVAAEAGLNIGSVRHYFDDHHDLVAAAVRETGDRMGRRLARHTPETLVGLQGEAAVDALQALVEEVLPVDDARCAETTVLLEFMVAARTKPVFRPVTEQMAADLHQLVADALDALGVADVHGEADRLTALIGGLTIDTVTPHGSLGVDRLRATLRAHLRAVLPPVLEG